MAKTLTIAGDNFLPQYKTNSCKVREIVQNKSNVMNMQIVVKSGQDKPQQGSEIVFKDGSRFIFAGFISRVSPREIGKGSMFIYDIEASDYSYIFSSKVAKIGYENKTLKEIVENLMSEYVDASYGFTTTNVATGPTIDSISFDHISLRKCFEILQKVTGYIWFTDYEKNLYFTVPSSDPAPETITDSSDNYSDITISYDTSQVRNSVTVIGSSDGAQSLALTQETFTGDGDTRSWELSDKPSQVISITLNGVAQQFSLDVNERETDIFVYSFSGQSLRITDTQTTPTAMDEIIISYYPRIPIISQADDPASIAFFAALDGGDGIYEYSIKDNSITSKVTALDRATQELADYSMPLVTGNLVTRTGLLSGGSIFSAGQYLTVNLPTYGINTDTAFLIQEVNIELDEDGTNTEYTYNVRFGGKMVGVQEFLESLVAEGENIQAQDTIVTLEKINEVEEVEDVAPSETIVTPPYQYGPAGSPQGKWNLSEWS